MLTLTQKTLVQESFALIAPIADDAAVLFYRRLFEIDRSLQGMFRGDMAEQRRKLMQMLTAAVKGLDRLDQLVPVVQELGRRHAAYGVLDAHYDTVGGALLWTLEMGLGAGFTAETREAWVTVYGLLATTMKEAAREALAGRVARGTRERDHRDRAIFPRRDEATVGCERERDDGALAGVERIDQRAAGGVAQLDRSRGEPYGDEVSGRVRSQRAHAFDADRPLEALVTARGRRRRDAAAIRRPSRKRTRSAASSAAV